MRKLVLITLFTLGASYNLVIAAAITNYERQIIASCLVLEAASDGIEGMRAVLNVIYNRADRRPERVVREAIKRGQFSSMHSIWGKRNPDYSPILRRAQRDRMYSSAVKLVLLMERGKLYDNTHGATYYCALNGDKPYWVNHFYYVTTIGSHRFYSERLLPTFSTR